MVRASLTECRSLRIVGALPFETVRRALDGVQQQFMVLRNASWPPRHDDLIPGPERGAVKPASVSCWGGAFDIQCLSFSSGADLMKECGFRQMNSLSVPDLWTCR
jgi:hypothetical protein